MQIQNYRETLLSEPKEGLKICVTIPAKNEGDYIGQTLASLNNQSGSAKDCFEVIVLVNHSSDKTLKVCRDFKAAHPELALHILTTYSDRIGHVGAARKKIMDLACARLRNNNFLIAMTDADTLVSSNWIKNLLNYIDQDIDLICGAIQVDTDGMSAFAKRMYTAKEYYLHNRSRLQSMLLPEPWNPWPSHAAASGPNMAIKKTAYKAIGGMPDLACLEDSAFYDRVVKLGLKVRHALDIPVETSARLDSRVERGFGNELNHWTTLDKGSNMYVEGLYKLQIRFWAYWLVEESYANKNGLHLAVITELLKLSHATLEKLFLVHKNHQSMNRALICILEKNKSWQREHPNISVFEANEELKLFFEFHPVSVTRTFPRAPVHRRDGKARSTG